MKGTLKQGDIIVFKTENDWLSKAIGWLTDSDASHAAMAYTEDSIVEVGAYGIGVHKVDIANGSMTYIMRLKSEPDPAPLIRSADHYLEAKVRYDFPSLFMLGGLLLHHHLVPGKRLFKVVEKILCACVQKLDEMIQHAILHHEDMPMVCSQLVYQIFYDCKGEYQIQIRNGCMQSIDGRGHAPGTVRLLDGLLESPQKQEKTDLDSLHLLSKAALADCFTKTGTEALAEELYGALCESRTTAAGDTIAGLQAAPADTAYARILGKSFLSKMMHLLDLAHCDIPLSAMFVTPADLVYHAVNLKKEGTVSLTRLHG